MIVTFAFYTALLVLLKITAQHGSNLVPDSEVAKLLADPREVKDRIFGSKLTLVVEQCMLHTQWGSKGRPPPLSALKTKPFQPVCSFSTIA